MSMHPDCNFSGDRFQAAVPFVCNLHILTLLNREQNNQVSDIQGDKI